MTGRGLFMDIAVTFLLRTFDNNKDNTITIFMTTFHLISF